MGDSNQYFICDGAVQPIAIQRALLSAIKTDIPSLDAEVADQLQSELENLGWEKLLFIVTQKAFSNNHWATLGLQIDSTITDLNTLENVPLGSIAIYERKSDIPDIQSESDNQVDIILSISDVHNNPAVTVEQKLAPKSKESAFIRFKKFVSKIKNGDKNKLVKEFLLVHRGVLHFYKLHDGK